MRTNLIEKKSAPKKALSTTDGMLDMVIAFDTTGSMSAYIGNVKQHVTDLIPKLMDANPNMRIGIVAFGDYCDMRSKNNFGNAYIEGERRVLRGFKLQFVSRDGKYRCLDMDIERTSKETGERFVNINTISELVYNGIKYVVK